MPTDFQPICPLCRLPADGGLRDLERALYFKCENKHELVVRLDVLQQLIDEPKDRRDRFAASAIERSDGRIAMFLNDAGRLRMELVHRSSWLQ